MHVITEDIISLIFNFHIPFHDQCCHSEKCKDLTEQFIKFYRGHSPYSATVYPTYHKGFLNAKHNSLNSKYISLSVNKD
jgi:hypothetical protein